MYLCISSEFALAKYRSAIEELKLDMFLQVLLKFENISETMFPEYWNCNRFLEGKLQFKFFSENINLIFVQMKLLRSQWKSELSKE